MERSHDTKTGGFCITDPLHQEGTVHSEDGVFYRSLYRPNFAMTRTRVFTHIRSFVVLGRCCQAAPDIGRVCIYVYNGAFAKSPPGPFVKSPPGPFVKSPPGPFVKSPPGPFDESPAGPFVKSPPGPFARSPPGPFVLLLLVLVLLLLLLWCCCQ